MAVTGAGRVGAAGRPFVCERVCVSCSSHPHRTVATSGLLASDTRRGGSDHALLAHELLRPVVGWPPLAWVPWRTASMSGDAGAAGVGEVTRCADAVLAPVTLRWVVQLAAPGVDLCPFRVNRGRRRRTRRWEQDGRGDAFSAAWTAPLRSSGKRRLYPLASWRGARRWAQPASGATAVKAPALTSATQPALPSEWGCCSTRDRATG